MNDGPSGATDRPKSRRLPRRPGLRRQILLGVVALMAVLSIAVIAQGLVVNEYVERIVWRTLLDGEFEHLMQRSAEDPAYRWVNSDTISLYGGPLGAPLPPTLHGYEPGLHDDVLINGREHVVLVREVEGEPVMLSLDATPLEEREQEMAGLITASALTMLVLMTLAIAWAVTRLLQPLREVAEHIGQLRPDRPGQHLAVPNAASSELVVIAEALNDYLERNARFVERERDFIDRTSHELRTPIAVIAGASAIAARQPDLPDSARGQIDRIQRTARHVDQLISLLLVLAKDPERLAAARDHVDLDALLPEIVDDHRYLTQDKDLVIAIAALPPCRIDAPLPIVQAAIGNLLRNAIEHSDRGTIHVRLDAPARVVIEDPGHGMSPEEISAIYARMARSGGDRGGGGIGLALIGRLCEHLQWQLDIASDHGQGTTTVLDFKPAPR